MIDGVRIIPLRQIADERGKIMHMLKATDEHFIAFGEIYFSRELERIDPFSPAIPYDWSLRHG